MGPYHTITRPTYSSHDVILQQVSHRPGETAKEDKPDEYFPARKDQEVRVILVFHFDKYDQKGQESRTLPLECSAD